MPLHNFNDLTKYKLRPISALLLYYPVGTQIQFTNLEQDSGYSVQPITRTDAKGGTRTIAHRVSITAYPMQDNYADIIKLLLENTNKPLDVNLSLGTKSPFGVVPHPAINANAPALLDLGYGCSLAWSIESADKRRRLKIEITKVYRTNADNLEDTGDPNPLYYLLSDED